MFMIGDRGDRTVGQAVPSRKRIEALRVATPLALLVGDAALADDTVLHASGAATFWYEAVTISAWK